MDPAASQPESFSASRRWGIGLNVAVSIVALVAIIVMANYLAARHFVRYRVGGGGRDPLSLPTRQVLAALTNDVRVTILFRRDNPLYPLVNDLLKEYAHASARVKLETVDYLRDEQLAQTTIARLQLPPTEADLVVFEGAGQTRIVRAAELSDYNLAELLAGEKEIRRIGFKGEPLFTDALAGLLEGKRPRAYFLQGHGEHDPTANETKFGYSHFARLLQQKNVAVAPLHLGRDGEIPEDCQLLIIAGPASRLDPAELEKINRYLGNGGRLLALLSFYKADRAPTGLEQLLAGWGVNVGNNLTFDVRNAVAGGGILATNFSGHAVARPLRGHALYVVLARSIEPMRNAGTVADAPRVEPLVRTSAEGFTASDATQAGLPRFNPARDRRGEITLAVAVEKGSIPGLAADRGSTRLVVVGESIFLANETIGKTAANLEFASLAVGWLLDRPQHLAGIPTRPVVEYQILLSRAQLVQLRWILLVLLPGAPLALGLLVWLRRRR